ncbi:MAG: hypothetical protein HKP58_17240 [Desulfatitalea sp.]|nr:hypothetical protein [Desulfatitalea sp.]NNK02159.1 hypothetical protein [Desulfatitalea sp.]
MTMKKGFIGLFLAFILSLVIGAPNPLEATTFSVFDRPLSLFGQLSQSVQYGWQDEYDTYQGINQALTTAIFEGDYKPSNRLKLYGMTTLNYNLVYPIYSDDSTWKRRQFDKSDEMAFDDEYWRILREIHATWTPGNNMVRVGKQIVSWGEMTGFRLLDQLNPTDAIRGPSDIEFETTIVPTWMVRYDQGLPLTSAWVSNVNFQVVWDPIVDNDIYTRGAGSGNEVWGIWAPYIEVPAPFPPGTLFGSTNLRLEKPEEWSDSRIGVRLQALLGEALVSFNFLYGRDIGPLTHTIGISPPTIIDGQLTAHFDQAGYFPIRRMIGGMFARELGFIPRIGGISAPFLRLEWAYLFNSTFYNLTNAEFEEHDDMRIAGSLEMSVPIRWLNPNQKFKFSGQYYLRHISDIEDGYENRVFSTEGAAEKYNHVTTISVSTNYWLSRLIPMVAWNHLWNSDSYLVKPTMTYLHSHKWSFVLGATFFGGNKEGQGMQIYDHKDYVSFKAQYKF